MTIHTNFARITCVIVLLLAAQERTARAQEAAAVPAADRVARLEAELKKASSELAAAQAKADEQSRRVTQLEQELKKSKGRVNELEEQVFVATDGKGVKGQEVVEELPEGTFAWTENMRRSPVGVLFPKTATIPKGDVYARFTHISQNQTFADGGRGDPFDDLLGLESGVKVGILFGYGITKNWDVMVQRSNGRDYIPAPFDPADTHRHSYDLWDVMTKVKLLDEEKQFIDLATSVGGTYFWQDDGEGKWAANAALLFEKSLWRFRVGSGLLYTSMSTFEGARSTQTATALDKLYPNEDAFGATRPQNHTLAIPVSLAFALGKNAQLFGEMAFPVDGYETGNGPSAAAGWRYNTHTHAYSIFLSNTANISYNSAFTGGYKHDRLDLFGFDISIFF